MLRLGLISLLGVLTVTGLLALGVWQVERRAMKLDLIQRVTERLAQTAQPPPGPDAWSNVDRQTAEFRRVRVTGSYLQMNDVLVQAVTVLGAGYWVLTPLRSERGFIVLINRGFVPMDRRDADGEHAPVGVVTVTGLLRLTEPKGGFLRHNDAAARRWYSRDVQAIASSLALSEVAPYFVDAEDSDPRPADGGPVPGLTVLRFANNHLQYAVTWFVLALMTSAALVWLWRQEWRQWQASKTG